MRQKAVPKQKGPPFHFFRLCQTSIFSFFPNFFIAPPTKFLIFCNRMDVQKLPKSIRFTFFWHYATYRKLQRISKKKSKVPFFRFLRAFVVSSCRKSSFQVSRGNFLVNHIFRCLLVICVATIHA